MTAQEHLWYYSHHQSFTTDKPSGSYWNKLFFFMTWTREKNNIHHLDKLSSQTDSWNIHHIHSARIRFEIVVHFFRRLLHVKSANGIEHHVTYSYKNFKKLVKWKLAFKAYVRHSIGTEIVCCCGRKIW